MAEPIQKFRTARVPWLLLPLVAVLAFMLGGMCLGEPPQAPADHVHEQSMWTCSMHPQIKEPAPGQCPICGMDLIPVETSGAAAAADQVILSPRAQAKARIRTARVERMGAGGVEQRLLGRVDYDETTLRTVTAWVGGRIDRLHVQTTGERVQAGQVIATLYSPEVFSAHQDLLQARQQVDRLSTRATPSAKDAAKAAFNAARDRLRLLGVPDGEIKKMSRASKPSEHIRIRSPFGGTVIERLATEGGYVSTGSGLYRIADLSRLWVQLDAYESDLPLLRLGQDVTLRVEALPGEDFEGRVTFVDPVINQQTRTSRVRIEVANHGRRLRPGMFAEATVRGQTAAGAEAPLVIPATAPLFTGRRSVVYVEVPDTSEPTYVSRVVRLGPKMGEHYPVLAGLKEGERVVVHGAFTLDADLQLRGGLSMMAAPDDAEPGPYDDVVDAPDELKRSLKKVLDHYLAVHAALAADEFETAQEAASRLQQAAKLRLREHSEAQDVWKPLRRALRQHAGLVSGAQSVDQARLAFRDLSHQIATLLRIFGNPTERALRLAFCPMALSGDGAEWVQTATEIENPYFGAKMHRCGEIHSVVEHGTYLPEHDHGHPSKDENAAPAGGHQH